MQNSSNLKQQIEQCEHEVKQEQLAYLQSKKNVHIELLNLKKHLPLISTLAIGSSIVLLVSPRTRQLLSRFNNKILVGLLNIRLGVTLISTIINSISQGYHLLLKLER